MCRRTWGGETGVLWGCGRLWAGVSAGEFRRRFGSGDENSEGDALCSISLAMTCVPPSLRRRSHCPRPISFGLSVLERRLIRYGQLLAALCTTGSQHLATVGGSHSLTETVLVDSLPARRLERSFHCHSCIVFIVSAHFAECKGISNIVNNQKIPLFFMHRTVSCGRPMVRKGGHGPVVGGYLPVCEGFISS